MPPKVHNKHARTAPPGAVCVGRGSQWGNPFKIGRDGDRSAVIRKFEETTLPTRDLRLLRGKHLICFCVPLACHADILLREANKPLESEQDK